MRDINYYFSILGLTPGASLEEVKGAYGDLVKVWHPDRFVHDPKLQAKAEEKLKEINEAFQKIQEFLDHLNAYQQATGAKQEDPESAKEERTQSQESPKEPPRPPQYPKEDIFHLKGTPIIDWTMKPEVAIYFSNDSKVR